MQTHGGEVAKNAIEGAERHFSATLLVDWAGDGQYNHPLSDMSHFVQSIDLDRSLQGSVPDEITLLEGAAAAELTAEIAGEYNGLPFSAVFSQYNVRSPFYTRELVGYEVKYSISVETVLGTVSYPQFVGNIRDIVPDRASAAVQLTALDRVEKLRSPVNFPKWAVSRYWLDRGRKRAQLTDSQWLIDHCLRQCNVSPTGYVPAPEFYDEPYSNMTRFFLSGTGSTAPGVGNYDNFTAQEFPDTEGGAGEMYTLSGAKPDRIDGPLPLCFAAHSDDYFSRYWVDEPSEANPYASHYISATIITRNGSQNAANGSPIARVHLSDGHLLELYVSQNQVRGRWYDEPGNTSYWTEWYTLPPSPDSVIVDFIVEWSDSLRMTFMLNSDPTPWEHLSSSRYPGWTNYYQTKGLVEVSRVVEFNDLYYQRDNWVNVGHVTDRYRTEADYFAALDPGRNRLTFIPERDGEDGWDIIKEVAAAEFGGVFWDEEGVFRFWNYDTINSKRDNIVRTLTLDEIEGLSLTNSLDSVRNVFSVDIRHKVGVFGTVFESDDPNTVYFPSDVRMDIPFPRGSCTCPRPFALVQHDTLANEGSGFPQWSDAAQHAYVPQWWTLNEDTSNIPNDYKWQENQFIEAAAGNQYLYISRDGYLTLSFDNYLSDPMRFATDPTTNGGQAKGAVRISGSYVEDQSNTVYQTKNQASIDRYGIRNLNLTGDWYQDRFQTENMLETVLDRTSRPVPVTDNIVIPGDPRIQLADTISIDDPEGFGDDLRCQVFGIKHSFTLDGGLTTELAVELVRPPGKWILGSPTYSVLGETTVL